MFITLLIVTFLVAALTAFIVASIFRSTIGKILNRIISEDLGIAWKKYILFALYVVGISGGVRIWQLEKYVVPAGESKTPAVLTTDRWVLEIYRTVIESLQSMAWMLLVFFLIALIAYVVVRGFELKHGKSSAGQE
jgi:hypothetical protein